MLSILNSDKTIAFTYKHKEKGDLVGKLYANICSAVTAPPKCANVQPSLVLFVADDSDDCIPLISSSIRDNDYILTDKTHPLDGFSIHKHDADFEVSIKCNPDIKEPEFTATANGLEVQSQNSCGEFNEAAKVFATHKYLLCIILVVVGAIFMTVGGYKWDALLGFIGFLVGFGFMFFIFWGFVGYKEESISYIIIFAIATIVGILCAYLCRTFAILSYVLMGFAAGFFLSKYLLTTFQFSGEKVS